MNKYYYTRYNSDAKLSSIFTLDISGTNDFFQNLNDFYLYHIIFCQILLMMFYHPKAIVVVGRSNDWDKAKLKSLHGLNSRLHGITIMTFDQLVGLGNRLLEILKNGSSESSQDDQNTNDPWEF